MKSVRRAIVSTWFVAMLSGCATELESFEETETASVSSSIERTVEDPRERERERDRPRDPRESTGFVGCCVTCGNTTTFCDLGKADITGCSVDPGAGTMACTYSLGEGFDSSTVQGGTGCVTGTDDEC